MVIFQEKIISNSQRKEAFVSAKATVNHMDCFDRDYFIDMLRRELPVSVTDRQAGLFFKYYCELIRVNRYMNLTAITEPKEVIRKHFCDSLLPLSLPYLKEGARCVDVGSGAGFPGLPLAIMRPDLDMTLMDSLGKRVDFLTETCEQLSMDRCRAVKIRAEEATETREAFDIAFSRGVARLSVLAEYCLPLVREGGVMIALKSLSAELEIEEAQNAMGILGGKLVEVFGTPERNAVVIEKISQTPSKYPRRAGIPEKRPL